MYSAAVRPFLAANTSTSRVIAESNETVMDMLEKMFFEYKSGLFKESENRFVQKWLTNGFFIGDVGIRNGPHSLICYLAFLPIQSPHPALRDMAS